MRMRIAQIAARIMAEDGIDDFGLAKRKAARQVGAPDTRNMPDNTEVEQALREYRDLYQAAEHPGRLAALRQAALGVMRLLAAHDPHLVGPVLSGSAGRYACVDLHLFTDEPKELEMFLINRRIEFRPYEVRAHVGGEARTVPGIEFDCDGTGFRVRVFSRRDLRLGVRLASEGRPQEGVRADAVERMLSMPTNG
jgi:hypothetical protein